MLDWLSSPHDLSDSLSFLYSIKNKLDSYKFKSIVLMGMGGSSNGPLVFQAVLAPSTFSNFHVIDTIHPSAIKRLQDQINFADTLFIVASKSGATLEPQILYRYFFGQLESQGIKEPARHFMAITDPITPLEQESQEQGFLPGPFGDPGIGGRYSALSTFGIMPALLLNIDAELVLKNAQIMAEICHRKQSEDNLGAKLGVFLGYHAQEGRDQLIFRFSKSLKPLGWWLEQLIAESLGKNNSGIIPIIDPDAYVNAQASMVCSIELIGEEHEPDKSALPRFSMTLNNKYEIGAHMFCWQIAISIAGVILGINPFDQPDVEKSKKLTRSILDRMQKEPERDILESEVQTKETAGLIIYEHNLSEFLIQARKKTYAALLSFLDNTTENIAYLKRLGQSISKKLNMPVLIQQGPSYLHSTGQLFKGGKNEGCFFLLTGPYATDLPSFYPGVGIKDIHLSQALGDAHAMAEAGRHIIHIRCKDTDVAFKELMALIES